MLVAGTFFRQIAACIVAPPPFLLHFGTFDLIFCLLHGVDISTT